MWFNRGFEQPGKPNHRLKPLTPGLANRWFGARYSTGLFEARLEARLVNRRLVIVIGPSGVQFRELSRE